MSDAPRDGTAFIAEFRDMRAARGFAVVAFVGDKLMPTLKIHGVVWDMEAVEWIGWTPLPDEARV